MRTNSKACCHFIKTEFLLFVSQSLFSSNDMGLHDEALSLYLSFHKHFSPHSHFKKRGKRLRGFRGKVNIVVVTVSVKYILHKTDAKSEGR